MYLAFATVPGLWRRWNWPGWMDSTRLIFVQSLQCSLAGIPGSTTLCKSDLLWSMCADRETTCIHNFPFWTSSRTSDGTPPPEKGRVPHSGSPTSCTNTTAGGLGDRAKLPASSSKLPAPSSISLTTFDIERAGIARKTKTALCSCFLRPCHHLCVLLRRCKTLRRVCNTRMNPRMRRRHAEAAWVA